MKSSGSHQILSIITQESQHEIARGGRSSGHHKVDDIDKLVKD
jgi:hypothetical protein